MTNLATELLEWSRRQLSWQQDLLRRIALGHILTTTDYRLYADAALREELNKDHPWANSLEAYEADEQFEALSEVHLSQVRAGVEPVSISRLLHVQGANDLAPGACLEFEGAGLTIIAGKNGSGKSGFTRILKQVAASRAAEKIIPNVFQPDAAPKAVVSYIMGDSRKVDELTWHQETENIESPLQRVRVFDTHSASVHLAGSTEIAYVPPTLQIIGEYTQALQAIASILESDKQSEELKRRNWPELEEDEGLKILGSLGKQSALDGLNELKALTPEEGDELEAIPKKITELTSSDPASQAIKARNLASQVNKLIRHVETVTGAISPDSVDATKKLLQNMKTAKHSANSARESLSGESMPQGSGSETWQKMWLAVKEFADEQNHEHEFPENAVTCPVCAQELEPMAKKNFRQFQKFMSGEAQTGYANAKRLWDEKVSYLSGLQIQEFFSEELAELIGTFDEALAADLSDALNRASKIRGYLTSLHDTESPDDAPRPKSVTDLLERHKAKLREFVEAEETRANELAEMDSSASAVTVIHNRQKSLNLRRSINEKRNEIKIEHDRTIRIACLNAAYASCNTNGASRKNSELSKGYVDAVCDQFSAETISLGLERVPVELSFDRSSRGVSYIKVKIKGAESAKVNQVLSEGEQRITAIAGFFADLTESGDLSALVFDDPVSSLDQEYRVEVAKRLLKESETRQVLVFTHDFSFVQYLYEEKKLNDLKLRKDGIEPGKELNYIHIARSADGAGVPTSAEVWRHVSIKERLGRLKGRQQAAAVLYRNSQLIAYEKEARDIVGAVRETWEAFVEQELLDSIVTRHERSVQTNRLKKIFKIKDSDVASVEYGMAIESRYMTGHTAPVSDGSGPVTPDWLLEEIHSLEKFRKSFLARK